jgi:hypothetical protein
MKRSRDLPDFPRSPVKFMQRKRGGLLLHLCSISVSAESDKADK